MSMGISRLLENLAETLAGLATLTRFGLLAGRLERMYIT